MFFPVAIIVISLIAQTFSVLVYFFFNAKTRKVLLMYFYVNKTRNYTPKKFFGIIARLGC